MERNPREDGEGLASDGEQGEQLRINSVVIPADEEEPLRQQLLAASGLADRQTLVGGYIEGLTLDKPLARMLMNEEGKYQGLPMNRRATLLLWMHSPRMRYQDVLMGDVILLGHSDEDTGTDTAVPDEYLQRLFTPNGKFRVETLVRGEKGWNTSRRTPFNNWLDAYDYALRKGWQHRRWVSDVRVVPEPEATSA